MGKPKVIKDYDKLSTEIVEQIKLLYPYGFKNHLITYKNREGEFRQGLPFETEDYYYLIRMTKAKAQTIIDEDEDYDIEGTLKESAKNKYQEKYEDEDFLNNNISDEDNDFSK